MPTSDYTAVCTGCGARMSNIDFNVHDCPMTPKPLEGESWADYKARVDAFRAAKQEN